MGSASVWQIDPTVTPAAAKAAADYLRQAVLDAGSGPEWPSQAFPLRLESVGVVGAGVMGSGIAISFLNAGIPVVLLDRSPEALAGGVARVREALQSSRRKGRLTAPDVEQMMALLHPTMEWGDLAAADWVVEAVFENLDLKRNVMAAMGKTCKPQAVLASNTSSLDIDDLARASGRPQDVVGMLFLVPANVQPLIEVVRGAASSDYALFMARQVAIRVRHIPVQSRVGFGFIGTRMVAAMLREADFLLLDGATPQQIDRAMESFGFAMGPCRSLDLIGLDTACQVLAEREKALAPNDHPAYRQPTKVLHAMGRLGQKSGQGYYTYEGRQPLPDATVMRVVADIASSHGIRRRRSIADSEIVGRCVLSLVNEAWRLLQEGIAHRQSDIDLIWAYGYGFPRSRGGPLYYAASQGTAAVRREMAAIARRSGDDRYGYWTANAA